MKENKQTEEQLTVKSKKNIYILLSLIVIVIIILTFTLGSKTSYEVGSETTEVAETSEVKSVENTTEINKLKSSEYTNSDFDAVEIGDSYDAVVEKMGELNTVEVESDFDVYSTEDEGTEYIFYFLDDKLEEVSIFIN